MPMLGAILTPHPPVLLPEVGRGREREIAATGRAMRAAAEAVTGWSPDVLIVASPPHHFVWRLFPYCPRQRCRGGYGRVRSAPGADRGGR